MSTPKTLDELRERVEQLEAQGMPLVRFEVSRRKLVPRGCVVRLWGRSGPRSSGDHKVERIEAGLCGAWWRTHDLRCWVDSPHAHASVMEQGS